MSQTIFDQRSNIKKIHMYIYVHCFSVVKNHDLKATNDRVDKGWIYEVCTCAFVCVCVSLCGGVWGAVH